MDKRTQLAVIMIALILGGQLSFSAYQQKKRAEAARVRHAAQVADSLAVLASQPPPAAPLAAAVPATTANPTAAPAATPTTGAVVFPTAMAEDGEWIVETPLQRIRIARAGAVLREIALQK